MFRISVKTLAHCEALLAEELRTLGAGDVEMGLRVVHCTGDMAAVYRFNYRLRTALRVLVQVTSFRARRPDDLHKKAMEFPWEEMFGIDQTFAIDPNVRSAQYRHPHFAALRLKDAIADRFAQRFGSRPDVDPARPDILLHLHVDEEQVSISLDSSGTSLNQRGYRRSGGTAPLNEVLAAAMLLHAGYDGSQVLYDPMCGSGTLSIEAASIALNRSPQLVRGEFGFMRWPTFDEVLWEEIVSESSKENRPLRAPILPSDVDHKQLALAVENIAAAGLQDILRPVLADFMTLEPTHSEGWLILNPPYGERMDQDQAEHLYRRIGERFKHHWPGFRAWVISSHTEALKSIGLKPFRKQELFNGKLSCRFQGYELYAGSRKGRSSSPEP